MHPRAGAALNAYRPARWLCGANAMTVFAALLRTGPRVPVRRERWELSDGDFVDVDVLDGPRRGPLLVVLHGLEGSSSAHYVRGLLAQGAQRGWRGVALNFRSCSGSPNRLLRSYHSGETSDLGQLISRLQKEADRIALVGCSLGGNVLVKWLGEQGAGVAPEIRAAAAVSVPFDLAACARTLDSRGLWRWVYRTRFLRTLKKKALDKGARFPGALDTERVRRSATLFEFDGAVTAAVHGFRDAPDYYAQCSSASFVPRVRVPLLLLSARDDPFIPSSCIPSDVPASVTLEVHPRGGHLGFVEGPPWAPRFYAERRAVEFLARHL